MDFGVSLEVNKEITASRSSSSLMTAEQNRNSEGMAYLAPGQVITGTVVAVDDQVTLDFDGHKVVTSKQVLKYAVPGDRKIFEVIKASSTEIEIKILEGNVKALRQTIKAITIKENDWETMRSKKEQAAKQAEKEKTFKEAQEKLEEISIKFTEQDYKALEREGFWAETMSVSGLFEAINRVKASMTQVGMISTKQAGEESSVKFTEEKIAVRLKEENLPVTKQNIDRIQKAIALSDIVVKIDDKAMKYLISRESEPTIENIYKAYYSGSAKHPEKRTELTAKEWDELEGQVEEIIRETGYEVNTENLSDARWLLENELPITSKTFTYKKKLDEIKANTDTDIIMDRIMEGMKSGTVPKDVTLATQSIPALEYIITNLNSVGEEAITYAIDEKLELNIKNLTAVQEDLSTGKISVNKGEAEETEDFPEDAEYKTDEENPPANRDYVEVKAKRQLEEIRLKMTIEAARRLENKGIHIETERLEKIVEELRKLEDSYYKRLLSEAEAEGTTQALHTLRTTTQNIDQLKLLPCAILGATLAERTTQTLPSLISSGTKLIADFEKAGITYETLATVPNAEYGDSIRKAFSNMDSLLSELNIENTQANLRAVRILGYNSMEITQEAIDQVKAYDKQVTSVMNNLHPAVTVRMIKEGVNPLSMPIDELNTAIDRMKEEQGISSEDKFSNYLHKLEKENGITPQERKAYIGIYRLLYNVEKSDGAALGAVIKADQEVTLSHLLTAVQTRRRGSVTAAIDDEFGMLTELNRNKESIAEQIKGFSNPMEETLNDNARKEARQEEQEKYLDRVVKQIAEEISPEKLRNLQQAGGMMAAAQQALSTEAPANASNKDLWETIKNVPLEKLLEQLQEIAEGEDTSGGDYVQKVQQIRELYKNSEQSLRFLNDYQMTGSPQNIMIANHILSNGISPIVRLLKRKNENSVENSENKLKELNEVSDTLIDKSSMNEAYKNLEAQAKEALTQACSQETLDSSKLAELKNIGQQMTFLRNMASREFYQIPIETEKGITNMNLTILRGSGITGRVSVTVWSKELGNIKAEFSLKEKTVKGFIACDNRHGLKRLQMEAAEIETAAKESNIDLKQLDFGISDIDYESYNYQNPKDPGQSTGEDLNTERTLYRLAKAFVQTVRLAENNVN